MAGISNASQQNADELDRGGRFPLLMSWWTICSAVFYLFLAATLAAVYGSLNAIVGIVLTVVTFSVLAPIMARRAVATGFSAQMMSERMFGKAGAALASFILGLTALYYAVFEGSILAITLSQVFSRLDYVMACLFVVLLTVPFILSERILVHFERANFILLPVYLLGLASLVVMAGMKFGWTFAWLAMGPDAPPPFGWWNCYLAYLGVWVLIVITTDFARFGRREDAHFHVRFTFGLPFYLMTFLLNGLVGIFLVGTVGIAAVSEAAIVDASLLVLGGGVGLAFIAATQLRINLANFYVSAFNSSSTIEALWGKRPPYWAIVLATCAVAAVVMAMQSAFTYMLASLQYMGVFICSWVGVALQSARATATADALAPHVERGALTAWLGATALAVLASFLPGLLGASAPAISFVAATLLARLLRTDGA